jgi:hypothetical protein
MIQSNPDLNEYLSHLIAEACQHAARSPQRQKILNQIIGHMQQSDKIWRGGAIDTDVYSEALQRTWLWFCEHLCEYEPSRANVFTWFNNKLRYVILDVTGQPKSDTTHRSDDEEIDFIGRIPDPKQNPSDVVEFQLLLEMIETWLEQQSRMLRRQHLQGRPDLNCQILIQYRLPATDQRSHLLVEGKTWKELAEEFETSSRQLSRCYNEKCLPCLRQFLKSQGYLSLSTKTHVSSRSDCN